MSSQTDLNSITPAVSGPCSSHRTASPLISATALLHRGEQDRRLSRHTLLFGINRSSDVQRYIYESGVSLIAQTSWTMFTVGRQLLNYTQSIWTVATRSRYRLQTDQPGESVTLVFGFYRDLSCQSASVLIQVVPGSPRNLKKQRKILSGRVSSEMSRRPACHGALLPPP